MKNNWVFLLLWYVVIAVLFWGSAANAESDYCLDYKDYPHLLSMAKIPENSFSLTMWGDLALIGNRQGLMVMDFSDPAHPQVLSQNDSLKTIRSLAVSGEWALGAGAKGRLVLLAISGSGQLEMVKEVGSVESATEVIWSDDLACVRMKNGVQFWNMKTPAKPQWLSSFWGASKPRDIIQTDGLVIIADQKNGVHIIDIADPKLPVQVGLLGGFSNISHIVVDGSILYAVISPEHSQRGCALMVADISEPGRANWVGKLEIPGSDVKDFLLQGDLAHILLSGGNLVTVNIADPVMPERYSILRVGYGEALADLRDAVAIMNRSSLSVAVFPGSHGEISPVSVWSGSLESLQRNCFAVKDGYGFLGSTDGLLQVLDLGDPINPVIVGELDSFSRISRVSFSPGGLLLVWSGNSNWTEVDVSNPRLPIRILDRAAAGRLVKAEERMLVHADAGIRFTFLTKLGFQVWVGEYRRSTGFTDVVVREDLFYAVSGDRVFHVGSFLDPTAPETVGLIKNFPGIGTSLLLDGSLVYTLTKSPDRMQIVDVSDPAIPILRGETLLPMMTRCALLVGEKLCIQTIGNDVIILDISDPDKPFIDGAFQTRYSSGSLAQAGGYLLFPSIGHFNMVLHRVPCP